MTARELEDMSVANRGCAFDPAWAAKIVCDYLVKHRPDVVALIGQGDLCLEIERDGDDGCAWWVSVDSEAPAEVHEAWGESTSSYADPDGRVQVYL